MKFELVFDSSDPFPLITDRKIPYEDEKSHATRVDAWLGFETATIEERLVESSTTKAADREFWIGKSVQTFSTPYTELRAALEDVQPRSGELIVDLGAGYGRLAHVLARHFPECRFVGFEIIRERQVEGQRIIELRNLKRAELKYQDVSTLDFQSLGATIFFLYDFGSRVDVERCLANIATLARFAAVTVIARGGRSRDVIEKQHPWLSQVVIPVHRVHYSIYRSREKSVENA